MPEALTLAMLGALDFTRVFHVEITAAGGITTTTAV